MAAPCFLFPGQGSQALGMGKGFFESIPAVKDLFEEASDIAGFDIAALCFSGPFDVLTQTANLQPAMTVVDLASYLALEQVDLIPSFVAGHSLGEFPALAAARVISFEDCIRLVVERGRLMQEQAEANPGAMSAIMRLEESTLEAIVQEVAAQDPVLIANYNSPQQLVVSGSLTGIEKVEERVREQRGRPVRLKVSGAWHSPLMAEAFDAFAEKIDAVEFQDARMPVLMNVTGLPAESGDEIKALMKKQMGSSVRWYQGIRYAWVNGTRTFVELGPKGVLTNMLKTIVSNPVSLNAFVVDSPIALKSFLEEEEI